MRHQPPHGADAYGPAAHPVMNAAGGMPPHPGGGLPFPPGPPGLSPMPPLPPRPPGPPGPAGFGFGGPMPHGPAPKVKKGDVRAAALALLAEGPRNGYQIIQEIAERSNGIWRPSPGSVYPALQQLEDEGLVRSEEDGGRRTYHLTEAGFAHLKERRDGAEPWEEVADSVSEEMVGLHHLLDQVGMAMRQVMIAGTPDQRGDAREILAGTRRALYRLLAEDPREDA
ncbi:PadR family transcriptional regulator [Actinoallomurus purpureus]|uniref:PadR family transcriptional regulator n=1 Tax=Actinoallomurus purpureus TaxID=478114 RepID=UPI002092775F|nr:PadR family transcriptional regulator [Actinoallomurus purpureus]MCO6003802.1 PadR family transcriptional regulator [Actinoallomurus purpureus]